jgi:DinB superfamily
MNPGRERREMTEIGERLISAVDQAEPRLRRFNQSEADGLVRPGGWSRKQVLGHLIDSASNNHQRFVRAALQDSLDFPGYEQEGCVRLQAPQEADWSLLVSLWASYNRYLAHVISRIPDSKRETTCRIGTGEPVTLAFLATDYVRHLVHHLRQIGVVDSE